MTPTPTPVVQTVVSACSVDLVGAVGGAYRSYRRARAVSVVAGASLCSCRGGEVGSISVGCDCCCSDCVTSRSMRRVKRTNVRR